MVWDTMDTLKEVWKVKDVIILIDPALEGGDKTATTTIVHCTIIKKKKNKPLAWKQFVFDWSITKDDVIQRVKAYFITEWLFGELKKDAFIYIFNVSQWKQQTWSSEFDVLFEMFDQNFRLII